MESKRINVGVNFLLKGCFCSRKNKKHMMKRLVSLHSDLFILVQRLRNLMNIKNKGCNQVVEICLAKVPVAVTKVLSFFSARKVSL